jgi:hypothetical protein
MIVRPVRIPVHTASSGRPASYGSCAEKARRDIAWKKQPVGDWKVAEEEIGRITGIKGCFGIRAKK